MDSGGRESVRVYGWMILGRGRGAPAHAAEDEEVEEVHPAKDEKHHAHLYGKGFNALLSRSDGVAEFQGHGHVAEVDQVKTDDKQVIDRIGEGFVAVEDVDEKHAAIFVEGAGDPDGQGDADSQVNHVCAYSDCHGQPP